MRYEESLSKVIQCETISKLGQTDLSKFYNSHNTLKELFPKIFEVAEYDDINGCMLLKWKGKNSDKPRLFMNHTDVVEASGEWKYPPFSGAIAEGKVWGRGTQDTKGGLWAMLAAANELAEEGFVPDQDTYFESAINEEISGEGANKIADILKERGIEFDFVIDEGGKIFRDGDGYISKVGLSEKGVNELEFVATSLGGHASRPERNSPLVRLGRFMAAVDDNLDTIFPPKLVEETGDMEQTSIGFTMAEGSEGRNVMPTRASIICSLRTSHHQGVDGSIKAISDFAKQFGVETNVLFLGMDVPISPWNEDGICSKIKEAVSSVYPNTKFQPYIMRGASDSTYFTKVCKNVYRFSPFLISEEQEASVHSIDENIDIAALAPAVEIFKALMR